MRSPTHFAAVRSSVLLLIWLAPLAARAEFASPPPDQAVIIEDSEPFGPGAPGSVVRAHVGPALDLGSGDAGLFAALDAGRRSIGLRLSVSAIGLGSADGRAVGAAELWVCPIEVGPVRPIVGAGVGLRDESRGEPEREHELSGVAVLRGGVELRLPISDADARAAVSVAGHIPAVVEEGGSERATTELAATLAVGF